MIECLKRLVGRGQDLQAASQRFERSLQDSNGREAACRCKELVTCSARLDTLAKRLPSNGQLEHAGGSS